MRVLYDYQILYLQKYGGISRYYHELLLHLRSLHPEDNFRIRAAISQNYYFGDMIPRRKLPKHGGRLLNDLNMKLGFAGDRLFDENADIIHPTYYMPTYISEKKSRRNKLIITVHDMTYEHYIQGDSKVIQAKRHLMKMADGIITISEHTKNDMLQIYPDLADKPISTIYLGIDDTSDRIGNDKAGLPEEFILFVGVRSGYKAFPMALEAFAGISTLYPHIYLVCAGGGEFTAEEKEQIGRYRVSEKVIQKSFNDSGLTQAFREAICFVYPSEYEGFGLPILEAYANSCPVLLRRSSCFPEISGEAALYFEDAESLAYLIKKVMEDDKQREDLIIRERERLKLFTWDNTSERTYDFYNRIMHG